MQILYLWFAPGKRSLNTTSQNMWVSNITAFEGKSTAQTTLTRKQILSETKGLNSIQGLRNINV